MSNIKTEILNEYLRSYRRLLDAEKVKRDTVIISLPFHFSRGHRVEVAVTRIGDQYLLSDMARTIGELKLCGYVITKSHRTKIAEIAQQSGVEIRKNELVRMSSAHEFGEALQSFAEVSKTVGDAYLVYRTHPASEMRIFDLVKEALDKRSVKYESKVKVLGALDEHQIDFYAPPNGKPGVAIGILARADTHPLAQIWDSKCRDLKDKYQNLKIGLVYDVEEARWSDVSRKLIEKAADRIIPSTEASVIAEYAEKVAS
jgi:hypothetical protein